MKARSLHRAAFAAIFAGAVAHPAVTAPGPDNDAASLAAIAYICGAEAKAAGDGERKLVMQPKMGSGGFAVTTNREAQSWFDYGLKLGYAFYHGDAPRAFDKAAELDPNCAMCAWGQGYARGRTLNYDVSKKERTEATRYAEKAVSLARTPRDLALTRALVARYSGKKTAELGFAQAMEAQGKAAPKADDLMILAAHSFMIASYWGEDQKQLDHGIALLETVLARSPDNTGAIHFYIHATEFAGQPEKALPYARKLAGLAPDASHLVHMAAHTFFRVGLYQDAALVNAQAIGVDTAYETAQNGKGKLSQAAPYYGHNLGFGLGGAMMSGDGALAVRFADHVAATFPAGLKDENMWQAGRAMAAYGRYAPDKAMALPVFDARSPAARVMRTYARGEVYALRKDPAGLRRELGAIAARQRNPDARIARAVLEGRLAMLENRSADAEAAFSKAAEVQEANYSGNMDPPPWWYPIERSRAAAQLKAGKLNQAEATALESLKTWQDEPLTLKVLAEAQRRQGRTAEAAVTLGRARAAWRGDLDAVAIEAI